MLQTFSSQLFGIMTRSQVFCTFIFYCSWILASSVFQEDDKNKILLVLGSGKSHGLQEALKNTTDLKYTRKDNLTYSDLSTGYFGSSLLDIWERRPPKKIKLWLTNSYEQDLWHIVFDTRNSTGSDLEKWFKTENLPSHDEQQVHINVTKAYPVVIGPIFNESLAYFVLYNTTVGAPLFIFANDTNVPFDLNIAPGIRYEYLHCFEATSVISEIAGDLNEMESSTMTVELCSSYCSERHYTHSGLQRSSVCHCVRDLPQKFVSSDKCDTRCTGSQEIQDPCGTDVLIAAYGIFQDPEARFIEKSVFTIVQRGDSPVGLDDLTVSLGSTPRLIKKVKVNIRAWEPQKIIQGTFNLEFSHHSCDTVKEFIPYKIQYSDNVKVFEVNTEHEIEMLKISCLRIIVSVTTPDVQDWEVGVTELTSGFASAPFLVLSGHYPKGTATESVSEGVVVYGTTVEDQTETLDHGIATTAIIQSSYLDELGDDSYSPFISMLLTDALPTSPVSGCCFCDCSMYSAYIRWQPNNGTETTTADIYSITNEIKHENTLNKTELSAYKRTKISAPDQRPSSKGIGCLGVVIISSFICCIVLMDMSHMKIAVLLIRDKLKPYK